MLANPYLYFHRRQQQK